jgi:hypothetical protein
VAKAAGAGQGALVPLSPPVWGPGLVEDVLTVSVVQHASAPVTPTVELPSLPIPRGMLLPPTPKPVAPTPPLRLPEPPPDRVSQVQVMQPSTSPRFAAPPEPARQSAPPVAPVATLTPAPRDRPAPKPLALSSAPVMNAQPEHHPAPPLPVLLPVGVQSTPPPATTSAPPVAPRPGPAPPDIRISIGHIRVIAPQQPTPAAAPVMAAPQAPKGQALKAYLGWRR